MSGEMLPGGAALSFLRPSRLPRLLEAIRSFALRHFVAIVGAIALASYVGLYASRPDSSPIHSDAFSYYVYLPSWFLYHDTTLESVASDCCGGAYPGFTAIVRSPVTGRFVNPHPVGVAVMMAPFLVAAHALTRWSNLPPDGFSLYYQHAAGLAGLTCLLVGLGILRRLLARHFSAGVTLATLAALTFGTNLFHYGVYDSAFSHIFSFCLVSGLMALTDRWWNAPTWRTSLALALVAGLAVLVRHASATFLLLIPLVGAADRPRVTAWLATLWERRRTLFSMALVAALCFAPQLASYHAATGSWYVNPYAQVGGFEHRGAPKILAVLFSVQKGLFFWSPILLLAVAGVAWPDRWSRRWRSAGVVIFVAQTLLIASWFDWQFGASFGHRGFTDSLPLFAPFLGSSIASIARWRRAKTPIAVAMTLMVALSIVQMLQYWLDILPAFDMTWSQYRALFLRLR